MIECNIFISQNTFLWMLHFGMQQIEIYQMNKIKMKAFHCFSFIFHLKIQLPSLNTVLKHAWQQLQHQVFFEYDATSLAHFFGKFLPFVFAESLKFHQVRALVHSHFQRCSFGFQSVLTGPLVDSNKMVIVINLHPSPVPGFLQTWDQRIFVWQTPDGLSCDFYWKVASVWPLYHTGLIGVVLQKWLSF